MDMKVGHPFIKLLPKMVKSLLFLFLAASAEVFLCHVVPHFVPSCILFPLEEHCNLRIAN